VFKLWAARKSTPQQTPVQTISTANMARRLLLRHRPAAKPQSLRRARWRNGIWIRSGAC